MNLKNVNFTGSVSEEDKIKWIKWSDFLVVPSVSKAEAFAIVQIEAMAYGKPVINTALPSGVPDVSLNGITGITVKPNNVEELYKAMNKLGSNQMLRDLYGKNAIDLVQKNYTMQRLSKKYKEYFENVLNS
jgi:rhamnosyl/mannosyltransferase